MAGKPGMHTRVLNPAAVQTRRNRIKVDRIVDKLHNHILDGEEMTASQVSAALGLLRKTVPDLSAVELSTDPDNPLTVITKIQREIIDP